MPNFCTTGYFTIEGHRSGKLSIFDMTGKLILQGSVDSNRYEMDLSEYPAGSYKIILTTTENDIIYETTLVKK